MSKRNVTVIGAGISGISIAYFLQDRFNVTLIEANKRLGGHTNTAQIKHDDKTHHIDTGFIVFNYKNYPNFTKFIKKLNVKYQDSDMSFGYFNNKNKFWYSSDFPSGIFAQKKNLFSKQYWKFLFEINTFNKRVNHDLKNKLIQDISLESYLKKLQLSHFFIHHYVLPMGAAIWSCPVETIMQFPAQQYFAFWDNHVLLSNTNRPTWKTITGGSNRYIEAFTKQFPGKIILGQPVSSINQNKSSVTIKLESGDELESDIAIIAAHADQALKMLTNPTNTQLNLLSKWSYSINNVILHHDESVMPPQKQAWASWMVNNPSHLSDSLFMSYYMNRLQNIQSHHHYFVTLNSQQEINPKKCFKQIDYTHPIFNRDSVETQLDLQKMNTDHLFFCGAYHGFGFHEDGIASSVKIAKSLGINW